MLNPDHELSEVAEEALTAWLATGRERPTISEEALYRLAAGVIEPEEAEDLVDALLYNAEDRDRLVDISTEMETLSAEPISERPGLAAWLRDAIGKSLTLHSSERERDPDGDWETRKDSFPIRDRIAAIARSLNLGASMPLLATARSEEPALQGYLPNGVSVILSAEIAPDGSLWASATFEAAVAGNASSLEGVSLCLELLDPVGGSVPIGCAPVRDGRWEMKADGFGSIAGMAAGPVPPSTFRLVVPNSPPALHQGNRIYVDVEEGIPTSFELAEEPRLERGSLVVTLGCTASRRSQYSDYWIELSLPLGSHLQVIGSWPMTDWENDLHTFRAPVPSVTESKLEIGSLLHVRLKLV